MDWVAFWTAVAAIAAIVAAIGVVGALLATTLQLRDARVDREDDYYRKLTPFLSFEVPHNPASDAPLEVDVYADGGGYAFNVIVNVVQSNSSTGQNAWLPGQTPVRYLRQGPPKRVDFAQLLGDTFLGYLTLQFKDTFGFSHSARQAVNLATGRLATTDAIEWTCDSRCRVHAMQPTPPPGRLTRLAQRLKLY